VAAGADGAVGGLLTQPPAQVIPFKVA